MQKLPLRPLRLVSYSTQQLDNSQIEEHNDHVEHKTNTRRGIASAPLLEKIQQYNPAVLMKLYQRQKAKHGSFSNVLLVVTCLIRHTACGPMAPYSC